MQKKIIFFSFLFMSVTSYTTEHDAIGIFHNIGKRSYQEDHYDYRHIDGGIWLGVYDGHGGDTVSKFLASNSGLAHIFSKTDKTKPIEHRMLETFLTANLQSEQYEETGSTASVVYIRDGKMHFAHVGDSRAIIPGIFTTLDHKPDRDDEKKRITKSRGNVTHLWNDVPRVNGLLAISRAIGDNYLKTWVISEPEYSQQSLNTNKMKYLIIASDGLYDKMSNEEIKENVDQNPNQSPKVLAQQLGKSAIQKGSTDNITVMVIDLQKLHSLPENLAITSNTSYSLKTKIMIGVGLFSLIALLMYKYRTLR